MQRAVLTLGFLVCILSPVDAQVDYQRDIRPILSNQCYRCHGPAVQKGKVRLDEREGLVREKVIVPGRPEQSTLVARVEAHDDADRMPPPEAGERLKPAQLAALRQWIREGAAFAPHWAFVKPQAQPLPAVRRQDWVRNPIDTLVLQRLEKAGLAPSAHADRATLLRRVHLDLTGLLPTPSEVDDFQGDGSPDAYEKVVDRLLASPHYAERQARHWLDLARYADSNGYTIDGKRTVWPYRDWVIQAFHRDVPFDRFTVEQLAGDLLPDATREQLTATGFQRNTPFNEEGGTNPEQFRVERTVDRTNTLGAVWLGLTVACAQCHAHKYDPLSQKEYFQLYAFFNNVDEPKIPLPTAEQTKTLAELNDQLARVRKAPAPSFQSAEEVERFLAEITQESGGGWQLIYPKMATAQLGTKLALQDDRSLLAVGPGATGESYTLQAVAPESGLISAVRIEALTDDSLPARGPGLGEKGEFVLSQVVFETDDGTDQKFQRAAASSEKRGFEASEVLKGNSKKGWTPAAGGEQQIVLHLERPYKVREGLPYTFTLRFSEAAKRGALGRFRVSVISASERFLDLPVEVQSLVLRGPEQRDAAVVARVQKLLQQNPPAASAVSKLQKEIKDLQGQIESTLVLKEAARPRVTQVHKRGDFLAPGETVRPGVPAFLPPSLPASGGSRLDLARWLVSPDHPLTARVAVNRVWQNLFGAGLVETENDFGIQGSLPTHPELLDWLAVEWMKQGWSMKKLHRLLVTSATYRQASGHRADLQARDPGNKLLGRQNRLRLDAEIVRDAALCASGLLTPTVGGPGVFPPQPPEIFAFTQNKHPWPESQGPDRYRRGMYTFIWRQSQHPLLTTFDAPDAQTACTRRNRSNTPLQALHLANDPTFVEFAAGLGKRIVREGPPDDAGRVEYAYKLCFARGPRDAERSRVLRFLETQRDAPAGEPWAMVARVLLNLDEFITRE